MTILADASFISLSVGILLLLRLSRLLFQGLADLMQHQKNRKLLIGQQIRSVQQPKK
ncbi:hypothetical protein [Paenibacillus maysiensis]|uniref:hypothetical protein n=1 Tax=Paenibacillus maysiensis TaxID=1155954 RepID=UPI0004AC90AB|nr:hypothetical protein [Paenibacillus maysiensis]